MNMPPWEYWLDGKEAVVATMRSSGTWDGEPRTRSGKRPDRE